MTKILELLRGKKTYILITIAGLVIAGYLAGFIDESAANNILTVLGFGSLLTIRTAIKGIKSN